MPAAPAAAAPLAVAPETMALSSGALREIARLEARVAATELGRRLFAETDAVARRGVELPDEPAVALYRPGAPALLVFNLPRLAQVTEYDFELGYVRAMARAAMGLPVGLADERLAAEQRVLEFALENCEKDPDFAQALAKAYGPMAAQARSLKASAAWLESRLGGPQELPVPLPRGEVERAAFHLALFSEAPDDFYWAVERAVPPTPALSALEDFLRLYEARIAADSGPESGPSAGARYAWIDGRRYPPALVRAARELAGRNAMERIREALGSFDTVGAEGLRQRLRRWLKSARRVDSGGHRGSPNSPRGESDL